MSERIDEVQAQYVAEEVPLRQEVFSVGAVLRQAREARSLPVEDVARALKLGARQVDALERDDWAALPGATFIRGFIRNYARLVDVDSVMLMSWLDKQLAKPADTLAVPEASPKEVRAGSRARDGLVVGLGALLLALAGLTYFLLPVDLAEWEARLAGLFGGKTAVETVVEQESAPSEPLFPPDATAQQLISPSLESPQGGLPEAVPPVVEQAVSAGNALAPAAQLRFVLSQPSWLEVRDRDDTVLFSQRLIAGSEQWVGGQGPFSVTIGYAPGVQLFHRGQVVNLVPHTRGDVARLVLE